jgi:hypothetical protein
VADGPLRVVPAAAVVERMKSRRSSLRLERYLATPLHSPGEATLRKTPAATSRTWSDLSPDQISELIPCRPQLVSGASMAFRKKAADEPPHDGAASQPPSLRVNCRLLLDTHSPLLPAFRKTLRNGRTSPLPLVSTTGHSGHKRRVRFV